MNISKPLCFLDLETTGLQIGTDRIISVGAVRRRANGLREAAYWLVNPERPIPAEVAELTGISDADVADAEPFAAVAQNVAAFLSGCVLVGFNVHNFDLPMLAEEMLRVGVPFDWQSFTVIDCGTIFKKKEERTLAAAVQFYCGAIMAGAHNALADAYATADVFDGQLSRYDDLSKMPLDELAAFSLMGEKRLDPAGKIVLKDGVAVYAFGKHKGCPVVDEPGFARWMLDKDFPYSTKLVIKRLFEERNARNSPRELVGH